MGILNCFVGDDSCAYYGLFDTGIFKKGIKMKKSTGLYLLFFLLFVNICGCAPLLIGVAAGGVGIYAAGKDAIQGETDQSYDTLWNAALKVSKIRGTVKHQDSLRGYIELQAGASRVSMKLTRLTRSTVRIKISARKYHMPDLGLAQELFTKITEEAGR